VDSSFLYFSSLYMFSTPSTGRLLFSFVVGGSLGVVSNLTLDDTGHSEGLLYLLILYVHLSISCKLPMLHLTLGLKLEHPLFLVTVVGLGALSALLGGPLGLPLVSNFLNFTSYREFLIIAVQKSFSPLKFSLKLLQAFLC